MSTAWEPTDELVEMIDSLCRGDIEPDQFTRLSDAITSDSSARSYYVRYLHVHAGLPRILRSSEASNLEHVTEADNAVGADIESQFPSLSPIPSSLSPPFVGGPVFSYMVASVVLCLMLLSAWAYKVTHHDNQIVNDPKSVPTSFDPRYELVAQITGMKDCRWTKPSSGDLIGPYVSLGREFDLASGLLEITYKTGAKIILEGPCVYAVNSTTSGYLGRGKLTARIESAKPRAASNPQSLIPSSLFSVTTPTAVVTDLGTEFGVEVNELGSTTSHVFRGSVRVQVVGNLREEVVLHKNGSAIVKKDAAQTRLVTGADVGDTPKFVREIPGTLQSLDARYAIDCSVFHDDFDGDTIDSDLWDAVTDNEISAPSGTISVIGGFAVLSTHSKEDAEKLENSSGLMYDTPGKKKVAYLLSKPGQLDFSNSPDDWWAEIRFQFTGNLDSPNWSPEWRTWAILCGEVDHCVVGAFDLRGVQRGSVNSPDFDLGWFGHDNSGDVDSSPPGRGMRIAKKLRVGLEKERFYTVTIHRRSDARIDVYLDRVLIATQPMIGGMNPTSLRIGDWLKWNVSGTCKVDYVKVGAMVPALPSSKKKSIDEGRNEAPINYQKRPIR